MMGMAEESKAEVLGIAHADAQKLLASSGASQIFSVQLPITFAHGDKLGVSFTSACSSSSSSSRRRSR